MRLGQTVIVPLQNGVDSRALIQKTFPTNLVTDDCVYIISRLEQPGLIVKKGPVAALFFGLAGTKDPRLDQLQVVFANSGMRSTYSQDIGKVIWEKFIFQSSIATATSYFDVVIEDIVNDATKLKALQQLVQEVSDLAVAKGIAIRANQLDRVQKILSGIPSGATASMHTDFQHKTSKTEPESLTGYIVRAGKLSNVSVDTFEIMYAQLKAI
ncbi:MAG: ketopantoate reductase C-terminal domain-containing protein [Bacteroidota bacterium]